MVFVRYSGLPATEIAAFCPTLLATFADVEAMNWTPANAQDASVSAIDEIFDEGVSDMQERRATWFERYVADFDRLFVHGSRAGCRRLAASLQALGLSVQGASHRSWSKIEARDSTGGDWTAAMGNKFGLELGPWDSVISTQSGLLIPQNLRSWEDFAYPRLLPARMVTWRWPGFSSEGKNRGGEFSLARFMERKTALEKSAAHFADTAALKHCLAQLRLYFGWGFPGRGDINYPSSPLMKREMVAAPGFDIDAWYEDELRESSVIVDFSAMNDRFFAPLIETQNPRVDVYIRACIAGSDAPLQSIKEQLGQRAATICTWLLTFDADVEHADAANDPQPAAEDFVSTLSPGRDWATYLSDLWLDAPHEDQAADLSNRASALSSQDFDAEQFAKSRPMDRAQMQYLAQQGQHIWGYFDSLKSEQSTFLRIRQAAWEPFDPHLARKIAKMMSDSPKLRLDWECATTLEILSIWGDSDALRGRKIHYVPGDCPACSRLIVSSVQGKKV